MEKCEVRYRTPTGTPMISVTQVLTVQRQIDRTWYTDEAAWRGQRVHELTEVFDRGEPLDVPAGLEGYLDAYATFVAVARPVYRATELAVRNIAQRVAGRIDRVCASLFGVPALVDFKTGDPQPWHGQQLAAYNWLHPTGARYACYLMKTGRYRLVQYSDPADHRRFMYHLAQTHGRVTTDGQYYYWSAAA